MKNHEVSPRHGGNQSQRRMLLVTFLSVCAWLDGFGVLNPGTARAETFSGTNHNTITINDYNNGDSAATPYPSTINVTGLTQQVSHITVTIWGLYHTSASDISMLLVDPSGTNGVVLMSQAGGGSLISVARLTFDDSAATGLYTIGQYWPVTNGTYRPTDAVNPATDNFFVPPAPPGPYSGALSTALTGFSGVNPNGNWSLYVEDESPGDSGVITNGWSLNIVTAPFYDRVDLSDPSQTQADWDGDGVTNLLEYAVGSAPQNSGDGNAGMLPQVLTVNGSRYLALQYKQRVDAATLQLQYLPEVSGDRNTWFSDGAHVLSVSTTPLDSEFNWVVVRDQTPLSASVPRFMRLRVVSASSESTSPWWVATDTEILGNTGAGSQLTLFSQRMVRSVADAGKITGLQSLSLTDTNATWSDGQFGTNGTPAYVEFDNGWMVDIANTFASTQTLLLADSLSGIAFVGNAYRIRPHFTIASLFGTNNEAGLTPGANPSSTDNILLQMPDSQTVMTVFWYSNSSSAFQGWVQANGFKPAANQVVYPEQGVMVQRIAPNNADLYLVGPVKTGVAAVPVQPGYNLVGTLKSLASVSLDNLNLYTGSSATGFVGGANPSFADNLLVVNLDGSVTTYFYYLNPGVTTFQGWVNANGFKVAGTVQIPPGSAFFINRVSPGVFTWTIPAE